MIKVNAVVNPKDVGYFFPGRVWKVLDDGRYLVICVGKHITIYREDELEVTDYKGYMVTFGRNGKKRPYWLPMTSLRKLKQRARRYHKDIWKKDRPKGTLPHHTRAYKE